jgi:hypothetical protein
MWWVASAALVDGCQRGHGACTLFTEPTTTVWPGDELTLLLAAEQPAFLSLRSGPQKLAGQSAGLS